MPTTGLDEAIERSAAPAAVDLAVTRLLEAAPDLASRLAADTALLDAVVAVTGASRSLTRRLLVEPAAIETLAALDGRPPVDGSSEKALVRWKHLEFLRIAARDLLGMDTLEVVGRSLATMAADVLGAACTLAGEEAAGGLAVIGMGKLGGEELNYASDVDIVFVGEGDPRRVMDVARYCFRVDADLRPEGRDGPLTRSLESYRAYWERWAEPWEFQALIKARPVAGDPELGGAFSAAAQHLWTRPFGADELRSVRAMKARAESEVARKGLTEREIKLGPGGIRDIEFSVQLLQLVHGRHDEALRCPTTLTALRELAAAGYVDPGDAATLEDAYRFLRNVEHRLQLVDEQQVHAVPADPPARTRLARVLGYRDDFASSALSRWEDDLRRHQAAVRAIHERLYFRPLLEAFSGGTAVMTREAAEARLTAFGFADADRTRQALRELTTGLTRSSRLMEQMMPLLLAWLSESPDPDRGLLGLRGLASGSHRASRLVAAFRESPEAARRLCCLVGTSSLVQRSLEQHPDMIPALADDRAMAARRPAELMEAAASSLGWRGAVEERRDALLRMKRIEELRIWARDILGLDDVAGTAAQLTGLAEAVLRSAMQVVEPALPMAVIAMGRFGGAELSYASDLDVLLVYDGRSPEDFAAAEEAAETLLRTVKGATPAGRIYLLDADLRPEGRQGPLARSLAGYAAYYERWAQTWERQALVRARPVAGDADLGRRFMELVDPFVWGPLSAEEVREIRRMKARVERERIPAGEDPQFHLKLGRGSLSDVEWTAQLLQLQHGIRSPGTMAALAALRQAGVLSGREEEVFADAYRFCERTRNRLFLVKGSPGSSLPTQADQLGRLARSLDTTGPRLRDDYRRVTRRARQEVERLFYGQDR